jgi:hypothetical protein
VRAVGVEHLAQAVGPGKAAISVFTVSTIIRNQACVAVSPSGNRSAR